MSGSFDLDLGAILKVRLTFMEMALFIESRGGRQGQIFESFSF